MKAPRRGYYHPRLGPPHVKSARIALESNTTTNETMKRPAMLVTTLAAMAILAALPGCKANAAYASPSPQSSAADAVHGTVLNEHGRQPLAGVVVAVGSQRTTSDADGHFALGGVSRTYDIVVADPNGASATVYRGVHRRDPWLVHKSAIPQQARAHRATIIGHVDGGPFDIANSATVRFASDRAQREVFLGSNAPRNTGPDYGPLAVDWDGPEAIEGDLVAQRTRRDPIADDAGAPDGSGPRRRGRSESAPVRTSTWIASQHVTVHDGQTLTVDLVPTPVPRLHTRVELLTQGNLHPTQLSESFYGSGSNTFVFGAGASPLGARTYELDLPDARGLGASLCAWATSSANGLGSFSSICDLPIDAPATLTLHAPPELRQPYAGSVFDPNTSFAWSGSDSPVYELELRDKVPTSMDPSVDIYTTETSAMWPDLSGFGVPFPAATAAYYVTIATLGPYSTMDDALGPHGIGVSHQRTAWRAESAKLELVVQPPPPTGAEDPRCRYQVDTRIDCDVLPKNVRVHREFYILADINNTLWWFPDLARASGLRCVLTCDQARAFTAARAAYANAHPAFEANVPIEMGPPLPPPPSP
jgi:hypothetical protein